MSPGFSYGLIKTHILGAFLISQQAGGRDAGLDKPGSSSAPLGRATGGGRSAPRGSGPDTGPRRLSGPP